jgi:hypothetical protein
MACNSLAWIATKWNVSPRAAIVGNFALPRKHIYIYIYIYIQYVKLVAASAELCAYGVVWVGALFRLSVGLLSTPLGDSIFFFLVG